MRVGDHTRDSLDRLHSANSMQKAQSRRLTEEEIETMKESQSLISGAHNFQELGYALSILGAIAQIAACGFAKTDTKGKFLLGVSKTLETSGNIEVKLCEAKIQKLQGLLELVRNELQNTQADEQSLTQRLQEIERSLVEAIKQEEDQIAAITRNR